MRGRGSFDGAEGQRRRDADRRASQLAAFARQGQNLGRAAHEEVHPGRHRAQGDGQQRRDRCAVGRRYRLLRLRAARWHRQQVAGAAVRLDRRRAGEEGREHRQDGAAADEELIADGFPWRARGAAYRHQGAAGHHPGQ